MSSGSAGSCDALFPYRTSTMNESAEFEGLCESLRRNDPSTTRVSFVTMFCHGKGLPLGEALSRNTQVESLGLPLEVIYNANDIPDYNEIKGILDFVKDSKSLRSFTLCGSGSREWHMAYAWMGAVASNKHIEELTVSHFDSYPLPPIATLRLFQTRTLKRLSMPILVYGSHEVLFNALKTIDTLEELTLTERGRLPERSASVIRSLQLPVHLRSLWLDLSFRIPTWKQVARHGHFHLLSEALASLIVAAPSSLTQFKISHFFDEEAMDCFLQALHQSQSITKLIFQYSSFSEEAVAMFVDYMREVNGVSTTGPGIRTLHLQLKDMPAAQLIEGPRGSNLEMLEVTATGTKDIANERWSDFVRCQSPQLTQLIFGGGTFSSVWSWSFIQHLPDLVFLRDLDVSCTSMQNLMRSVRNNGSLHILKARRYVLKFADPELISNNPQVDAYLQRNRHLPELLAEERLNDDTVSMCTDGDCDEDNRRRVTDTSSSSSTNLALMPELLLVATHTPRMTANHMLKGFLAKKGSIGGSSAGSRKRTAENKLGLGQSDERKRAKTQAT